MADWEKTAAYLESMARERDLIMGEIDVEAYADEPKWAHQIKQVTSYRDQVVGLFFPIEGEVKFAGPLPWGEAREVAFRPHEVTLWNGANGSGKSLLLGQVALGFAQAKESVVLASMEMRPERTLYRMVRQATGSQYPNRRDIERALDRMAGHIRIYEHLGSISQREMVAVARYCAAELKVDHIMIDSLLKCGIREDDYDGQKKFLDDLTALGKPYPVHIHLVTHPRKAEDDTRRPSKYDVRGASAITDQVDNVCNVWRNRPKERAIENGSVDPAMLAAPDMTLMWDKQRNGEWEGTMRLWYDRPSMQYVYARGRGSMLLLRGKDDE